MFERTGKVYKQGGLTMTIPQVYAEALGINVGDTVNLSLDMENKTFSVGKTSGHKVQEVLDLLASMGLSQELIKEIRQDLDDTENN